MKKIMLFIFIILGSIQMSVGQSEIVIKKNATEEIQISIPTIYKNTFIGDKAGDANTPSAMLGHDNVFIGDQSGMSNTEGSSNTFVGSGSGKSVTSGFQNTFIGDFSGRNNTGSTNTFLGSSTGFTNLGGSGNIFLGNKAGHYETGSNKLYISNDLTDQNNTLIYGEFDNAKLRINGHTDIYSNANNDEGLSVLKTHTGDSDIPAYTRKQYN